VFNFSKYISAKVKIDRSSRNLDQLSTIFIPDFKEEILFLKVLLEGESNLYYYEDRNLVRFFYSTKNSEIEQLIYKPYKSQVNILRYNNTFRMQLAQKLKCSNSTSPNYNSLSYNTEQLIKVFKNHNICIGANFKDLSTKSKKGNINLTLKLKAINSSYNTTISRQPTDFDNKTSIGFGVEIEYIFRFNKNKWAFLVDPSFQSYKSDLTVDVPGSIRTRSLKVDYKSIEIPVGVRHYMFLDDNSKLFVNAFVVFDIPFNSTFQSNRGAFESNINEIQTSSNLGIGLGYNFKNKFNIEIRRNGSRSILGFLGSDEDSYKSIAITFGYTIF